MLASKLLMCSSVLMTSVAGHGLIKFPKSRNQFCGEEIRPDRASGTKECDKVFDGDGQRGYNFMAVLTHALGRAKVRPLPNNVCGFNSESWNGGATPWDRPLDWPTNDMTTGRNKFVWNIETGPHFDDTDDFKYWITKPGFQFTVGKALTWDDFETEPFCTLYYNDKTPNANPDIVPDKAGATFTTWCTIPERGGRHVIYAEWGRRESTFERFHGCIDAKFAGNTGTETDEPGTTPHPTAMSTPTPPSPTSPPGPTPQPVPLTPHPSGPCMAAERVGSYDACHQAPNCCAEGWTCVPSNPYYSQCRPADEPKPNPGPETPEDSTPKPPAATTPKPPPAPGTPCRLYQGCGHDSDCCVAPARCMRQSQYYSQCLTTCPPTWECAKPV